MVSKYTYGNCYCPEPKRKDNGDICLLCGGKRNDWNIEKVVKKRKKKCTINKGEK